MRVPSFEVKENGVPHLSQNQFESIAETIVRDLSPQSFQGKIDATDLHRLLAAMEGWHYRGAYLSRSGNLLGMAAFQAGVVHVTDEKRQSLLPLSIQEHTILVDKALYRKDLEPVFRFTFAHEYGHALLHERFCQDPKNMQIYAAQGKEKILKDSAQELSCREEHRLHTERDWLEWQANAFASCLLLPRTLVLQVSKIIRGQSESEVEYLNDLKLNLSDVFKVSSSAAFYRMKTLHLLPENARLTKGGMIVTGVSHTDFS